MITRLISAILAAVLCWGTAAGACDATSIVSPLKPRLVVLTDIGPAEVEPDDNESAVRLMAYADRFEIEAICTTVGWNCDPYPAEWAEYLQRVIDAYEKDVPNLMRRSAQTGFLPIEQEQGAQSLGYWPSAEYLRSRAVSGSVRAGIGVIGEGNDSPGSELIIALVDEDDPRPLYVTSWGGANTLAQAIWRVQQTRTPAEIDAFLSKLRLYTITDQDMQWSMREDRDYSSHMWMRREFGDRLLFVWDESAWLNQNALGKDSWDDYARLIQPCGALGAVYPRYLWGVEGDTPSFLNAMPNGLNDPDDPKQVGWGGYHVWGVSPDCKTSCYTNWREPEHSVSDCYERRFYPDEFADFAARMAWARDGEGNTNPVAVVNGDTSLTPLRMRVRPGDRVSLDASSSFDPEGDTLSFCWWRQADAYRKHAELTDSSSFVYEVPTDAVGTLHLVCEVRDDGPFRLVSYRRVILEIDR